MKAKKQREELINQILTSGQPITGETLKQVWNDGYNKAVAIANERQLKGYDIGATTKRVFRG